MQPSFHAGNLRVPNCSDKPLGKQKLAPSPWSLCCKTAKEKSAHRQDSRCENFGGEDISQQGGENRTIIPLNRLSIALQHGRRRQHFHRSVLPGEG